MPPGPRLRCMRNQRKSLAIIIGVGGIREPICGTFRTLGHAWLKHQVGEIAEVSRSGEGSPCVSPNS